MADLGNMTKDETLAYAQAKEARLEDLTVKAELNALTVKKLQGAANKAERDAQAAEATTAASATAVAELNASVKNALAALNADLSNKTKQEEYENAKHAQSYAQATYDADKANSDKARSSANAALAKLDTEKAATSSIASEIATVSSDAKAARAEYEKYTAGQSYPDQKPLEEDSGISGLVNSAKDTYADIKDNLTGANTIDEDTQDKIDASGSDPTVSIEIYGKVPTEEELINIDLSSSDPDTVKEAIARQQKLKTDVGKQEDTSSSTNDSAVDLTKITAPNDYKNNPTTKPSDGTIDVVEGTGWESTHYADDLLNSQITGIKPKFLYKVKFVYNPNTGLKKEEMEKLQKAQFLVKTIDKPTIQMEHQDVNYYNYRTKVMTKIMFNPLNMVFFDDASNFVTNMFGRYMSYISPLFGRTAATDLPERCGMVTDKTQSSASSRSDYSFMKEIIVQQIYGHGKASTIFRFINPRIEQFDFDGLDHEDSAPNLITCSFIYDYIVVETPSGGALIYNAQEMVGAKTDIFAGGAVSSRSGIKTASLANLMSTVNSLNGGNPQTVAGTVWDVAKSGNYALAGISGVSDVDIASTLDIDKLGANYVDKKMFNYSGKVSSKLNGMSPVAKKILSPLANQSLTALSKPLRGLSSMFDNTVAGAANGVGQAASDSVTTGINATINGVAPGVNSAISSIGTSLNGVTQSVAGSFKSVTSDINKSISSGISSTIGGITSFFSSETKDANIGVNSVDGSTATEKPAEGVDKVS
jgi:hypothetical protein